MSSRQSVTEQLYRHAVRYGAPFRADYGQACVSIPHGILTHQVAPVRSQRVRDWLAVSFLREFNIFPTRSALRESIDMLEAQAHCGEFPSKPVDLRIGSRGHRFAPEEILFNLANDAAEAVRITADGWTITTGESLTFRQSRASKPLPEPSAIDHRRAPGVLPPAFRFNAMDRARITAWLLAAVRPTGPYPILVLSGPSGSGRNTLARMLRAFLDPSECPLAPLPQNERELFDLAWNNRIIALDHVSYLPAVLHDPLCRLASGGGFELRESASDTDPLRLTVERPVLITVPREPGEKGEWRVPVALQNLALTVELSEIEPPRLRDQQDLWAEFEAARPAMLAAFCTAISTALANAGNSTYDAAPRLPHLARWAGAAAPALDTTRQEFLAALVRDPLAIAVADFIRESSAWSGNAAELLTILESREVPGLPATPKALSERLHRASLHTLGIDLRDAGGKDQLLHLTSQPIATETPSSKKTKSKTQ